MGKIQIKFDEREFMLIRAIIAQEYAEVENGKKAHQYSAQDKRELFELNRQLQEFVIQ